MIPRRPRALAAALLLALAWSGPADARKKKNVEPAPASQTTEATSSTSSEAIAAATEMLGNTRMTSDIKLLDAGAEPRQVLRLHPTAGATERVEMVMDMQMSMNVMGQQNTVDMPPMIMVMAMKVGEVGADGSFAVDTVLEGAKVQDDGTSPPELVASMRDSMGALSGLTVFARMDGQGRTLETRAAVPSDPALSANMNSFQQNVAMSQVLLPAEPIGVGGSWSTTSKITTNGVPMDTITTYTLRERDGDAVVLDVALAMSVDPTAKISAVPGVDVSFKQFDASGKGQIRWDLGHIIGLSNLGQTMHMVMEGRQGDQVFTVGMDMGMKLEMRQAP